MEVYPSLMEHLLNDHEDHPNFRHSLLSLLENQWKFFEFAGKSMESQNFSMKRKPL